MEEEKIERIVMRKPVPVDNYPKAITILLDMLASIQHRIELEEKLNDCDVRNNIAKRTAITTNFIIEVEKADILKEEISRILGFENSDDFMYFADNFFKIN